MERQIGMLAMPALRPEQIASQQDKNEVRFNTYSKSPNNAKKYFIDIRIYVCRFLSVVDNPFFKLCSKVI